MYAVYTSYTVGQTANKGDASMTESIEEAVKNVVLVIGADLNNSNRSNSEEAQNIRKFISMLVKPFPFAEPLLSSLTSGVSQ
ncbi:hypothetical protein ADEAN_000242100 [Angomonas deanei]|uniref:Uncharacterized protein n=1 Tax=Angomonas deanei TaxID=59799 RepID=A0A7G2C575_9TRYP|nr:hypothetical protein ADEAN_000242100 [Angomonas deanei]